MACLFILVQVNTYRHIQGIPNIGDFVNLYVPAESKRGFIMSTVYEVFNCVCYKAKSNAIPTEAHNHLTAFDKLTLTEVYGRISVNAYYRTILQP